MRTIIEWSYGKGQYKLSILSGEHDGFVTSERSKHILCYISLFNQCSHLYNEHCIFLSDPGRRDVVRLSMMEVMIDSELVFIPVNPRIWIPDISRKICDIETYGLSYSC